MKKWLLSASALLFLVIGGTAFADESRYVDYHPEWQDYKVSGIDGNGQQFNHFWQLKPEPRYSFDRERARLVGGWLAPLDKLLASMNEQEKKEMQGILNTIDNTKGRTQRSEIFNCNLFLRHMNQKYMPYVEVGRRGFCSP